MTGAHPVTVAPLVSCNIYGEILKNPVSEIYERERREFEVVATGGIYRIGIAPSTKMAALASDLSST